MLRSSSRATTSRPTFAPRRRRARSPQAVGQGRGLQHLPHPPRQIGVAGRVDAVGGTDLELAAVVDRFETTAYDQVGAHGGRVVKMIGDEVMFEAPDPPTGVETLRRPCSVTWTSVAPR